MSERIGQRPINREYLIRTAFTVGSVRTVSASWEEFDSMQLAINYCNRMSTSPGVQMWVEDVRDD